jgi:DNA polymerase I
MLSPEEKKKLFGLFNNVKKDVEQDHVNWKRNTNSDILIVDGTNTFLRCWSAIPSMGDNGDHNGGIVGFLKSVGAAIKLLRPTRCIVVFDGAGGSFKRRKLFPQYKERRAGKIRLNRAYEDNVDADDEDKNRTRQYIRLVDYLQHVPVNVLSVDHVEADDVIAFLAVDTFKESRNVSIMSSDKDFLQLTGGNIRVWSPTKKRVYGPSEVLEEYWKNMVFIRTTL